MRIRIKRVKQNWCVTLAFVIGLESLAPASWAGPREIPEPLGESFARIKTFARSAEAPVAVELPDLILPPLPAPRVSDPEPSAPAVETEVAREVAREVEIPPPAPPVVAEPLPKSVVITPSALIRTDRSPRALRAVKHREAALRHEIVQIVRAVHPGEDELEISIVDSIFPVVRRYGPQTLELTTGLFAFVQNRDELAGVIAQEFARRDPAVFGHRDDPRITRRLEEQVAFDQLKPIQKLWVQADLSAIERLRACDLRPWGLTDFELRTFRFFRDSWANRKAYFMSAVMWSQDRRADFYEDDLFEARSLAQKLTVSYLQEREKLGELVRVTHEFGPELAAVHRAMRRDFALFLRPWGVPLALAAYLGGAGVLAVPALVDFDTMAEVANAGLGRVAALLGITDLDSVRTALRPVTDAVGVGYEFMRASVTKIGEILWALIVFTFGQIATIAAAIGAGVVWTLVNLFKLLGFISHSFWSLFGLGDNHSTLSVFALNAFMVFSNRKGGMRKAVRAGYYELRHLESVIVAHAGALFRRDAVARRLSAPPGAPLNEQRFIDIAAELRVLYASVIVPPFSTALYNDPGALRELRDLYHRPDDFWNFLKQFLRVVSLETEAGRLRPAALAQIFAALEPDDLPSELQPARLAVLNAEASLSVEMLNWRSTRRQLAAVYRTIEHRYPGVRRPLVEYERKAPVWTELNGSSVGPSTFLGVARLAAEAEDLAAEPDLPRLTALHQLAFDRLQALEFVLAVHKTQYATLSRAVFDGKFPAAVAAEYREMLESARDWSERPDRRRQVKESWPVAAERLYWQSGAALAAGQLGKAVAIASWQAGAPNRPRLNHPSTVLWRAANAWPGELLTQSLNAAFFWRMRRFETVRDLSAWLDAEVIARGANEDVLTPVLYRYVLDHPNLIRDVADVDDLLAHEYYWPRSAIAPGGFSQLVRVFNLLFRRFRPLDEALSTALQARAKASPRVWKYENKLAEGLHRMIVDRLTALDQMPSDFRQLRPFWLDLTERGVTAETDRLMQLLIERAPPTEVEALRALAIDDGRVWETELHSRLSIARAESSESYQNLRATGVDHPGRVGMIDEVITSLAGSIPERGLSYAQFLENLSVSINSSYPEAKRINRAKGDVSSVKDADSSVNTLRDIFRGMDRWSPKEKFNFVLVLRGEAKPRPRVLAAFPRVGLERVRRMYEVMPVAGRTGVLDTFFTHSLLDDGPQGKRWTKILAKHIVGGNKTEAQRVTLQVLTAFLAAMEKVGNAQMNTTILSYLYALPSQTATSPVEVLKLVLEIFGATGIKVGQFLYASQVLGEDGFALRTLQSKARVPDRIEMYEDLYDLLGVPVGTPLPFVMLELLGAASMKYAFLAQDQTNLQKLVFKVFRIDAMNNVEQQFDVLEHMGNYLVENHGARYGVLKIIVKTARLAVKREGSMKNENRRSAIARAHIYDHRSTPEVTVEAPFEELLNDRLILAEFAAGRGFDDLPNDVKPAFARALLEIETDILFDQNDVARFDPDRHAGNARLDAGSVLALRPIDFGQLIRLKATQRERITKLFALAQFAGKGGVNGWILNEIADLLGLDDLQRERLRKNLRAYLKDSRETPVSTYIATLAALEASGFEITDTTYVDFVRAIIQLTPFEAYAPDARSPRAAFQAAVETQIDAYLKVFEHDPHQLGAIKAINLWRRTKSALTGRDVALIPTDLSQVSFADLIQTERRGDCQRRLVGGVE